VEDDGLVELHRIGRRLERSHLNRLGVVTDQDDRDLRQIANEMNHE
jgi:hypothetical protein